MKVAIMQPTYIPWIGYFALMDSVDVFVFLNSVQFSYQSWQQHNQIKTAHGPQKLTIPVLAKSKGRCNQLIHQVMIDHSNHHLFPEKHIRSIEFNYQKAPYFEKYAPTLFTILRQEHILLADLTQKLILWLKDQFGIATHIKYSIDMPHSGSKAELIAHLCENLGATDYFSPQRASDYIGNAVPFRQRHIALHYQTFNHPQYLQLYGEFCPYMSAIDLLFNMGYNSLEIIRQGCQIKEGCAA